MPFIDPILLKAASRNRVACPSRLRATRHGHAVIGDVGAQRLAQQPFNVENQRDTSVAENRRPRHTRQFAEHASERLDHRLALAEQPIDDQADALLLHAQHEHVLALGPLSAETEAFAEAQIRQRLATQVDEPAIAGIADVDAWELDALDDRVERHHVGLALDAHGEAADDRQCQRQSQRERGAGADAAVDCDRSAQLLDVATDDIHSDAATRVLGDRRGRGKAGIEDQPIDLAIRQLVEIGRISHRSRALDNLSAIETGAVILYLDDDRAALVPRLQLDAAAWILARLPPLVGCLDAVIDGIADDVR